MGSAKLSGPRMQRERIEHIFVRRPTLRRSTPIAQVLLLNALTAFLLNLAVFLLIGKVSEGAVVPPPSSSRALLIFFE